MRTPNFCKIETSHPATNISRICVKQKGLVITSNI